MQTRKIIENAKLTIPKERIYYNEPMKKHTTFKVGGPAEIYIKIQTIEELKQIKELAEKEQIPTTIIGNGSNILVTDKGIKGLVIKIEIKKLEIQKEAEDKIEITVGAGNKLAELTQNLAKQNISGLEELSGIPGTIGGAIKMNAGAHGKEIKDIIKQVKILDETNNIKTLQNNDLQFGYRKSIFTKQKYIILEATLNLTTAPKEQIQEKIKKYLKIRKQNQPLEYPSAGSTFKREENFITAQQIDEAGLKGYQIGGAAISEKHAGFIINKGNATAQDIQDLIKYIQNKIYEKTGKKIELEIEIIGEQ